MASEDTEPCANPLYLGFIKEEWDLAKLRNSKSESAYKRAYLSLSSCPLQFSHPCETKQLSGIGDKIVNQLVEKLRAHCEQSGRSMPKKPSAKDRKRVNSELSDPLAEVPPPKKVRKQKPYVPSRRTGPYAILIALSSLREDTIQCLSKEQVIQLAQPHCDSSFTDPDRGSHYTAWASMRTLIDKDLVHERGRPKRNYALTEEGWETARRIRGFEKGQTLLSEGSGTETNSVPRNRTTRDRCQQESTAFIPIEDLDGASSRREPQNLNDELLDEPIRESPATRTLGIRPGDKFGLKAPTPNKRSKNKIVPEVVELLSSPEPETRPSWNEGMRKTNEARATPRPSAIESERLVPMASPSVRSDPEPRVAICSETNLPLFEPIIVPPGSFEVRLVLDNREIRSKESREAITNGLSKLGTPAISRPLAVGDAMWVAKLRDENHLARHHEEGSELTLDWIVERKRRDDLIGSIKDGRFHEQKFRLGRSGIKNVVYLLEFYHLSKENEEAFAEKLDSSIVSMQVVNDFFVKRTLGNDDTISYLSQMTKYLKEEYESKALYLIPSSVLAPGTFLPLLHHLRSDPAHVERTYTITMPSFESLASKSDTLTLRDVFLKMLMCTKGLTGDKAIAIQKIWPTPIALIEAYENCQDHNERERMVERSLGSAVGRGSVKSALSTKLSRVWAQSQVRLKSV